MALTQTKRSQRRVKRSDRIDAAYQMMLQELAAEKSASSARARHKYKAVGANLRLWESASDEICYSGPAGTGKSRAMLEWLDEQMRAYPGARALIVRKTRRSLAESAMVTFEDHVLEPDDPVNTHIQRTHRHSYGYPNESEIVLGGMDKPTKVMSTEYDIIYCQEAIEFTESEIEQLSSRLRNGKMPFQRLVMDTNPDSPRHWIKQRAGRGDLELVETRHEDNARMYDAESGEWTPYGIAYLRKLDKLTGVRKDRLRYGKWVQAEGVVYELYDRRVHLIDRFDVPASWRRVRAIDFGYGNPFSCLWGAINPDGDIYVYREIYMTKRLVEDHAAQIVELSAGERIEATVADHDAEDRATLERHGVPTIPAHKAISTGIQNVSARMRVDEVTGRPRLFIMRDSLVERDEALADAKLPLCLDDEMDAYMWPKGQTGKSVKEVPVDESNHAEDGLRYLCAYVDRLGNADQGSAKVQAGATRDHPMIVKPGQDRRSEPRRLPAKIGFR